MRGLRLTEDIICLYCGKTKERCTCEHKAWVKTGGLTPLDATLGFYPFGSKTRKELKRYGAIRLSKRFNR